MTNAQQAETIALNRYRTGLVSYLDVVYAQTALLENQRTATQISGQRMVATVVLIKALGGGWDAASLQAVHVKTTAGQALQP